MISRKLVNRIIILLFMALVGFSLAKGIRSQSVMGIILSITSLCAGICFLYLLAKLKQQQEREEIA